MTTKRLVIASMRLHLVQRHGRADRLDVEEVADGGQRLLADQVTVGLVGILVVVLAGGLNRLDEGGRVPVRFAIALELDQPIVRQPRRHFGEGGGMTLADIGLDLGQADPAEAGGGAGEAAVDQLLAEPDGLEDLGAPVAHRGGDAHLGDHLQEAVLHRVDEVARSSSGRISS